MDTKITLAFYHFACARCYTPARVVSAAAEPVFAAAFVLAAVWVYSSGGAADAALFALVPAMNAGLTFCLRRIVRRKRPFEVLGLTPPPGCKPGLSFPSNHAAAAAIISFSCLTVHEGLGAALFAAAAALGLARIALAAHYPSDVCFAFLQSAVVAVAGFNGLPLVIAAFA